MIELIYSYSGGDIDDPDGEYIGYSIMVGGEKVGDVLLKHWDDGTALIERIDIDENQRCKGYGTDAIKQVSADHDKCFIVPDNRRAAALYERIGCETCDDLWLHLDCGFGVYRV